MARPVVDLPQPDSPTSPSDSPRLTEKLTPSTACTAPTLRWKMIPFVRGKCITRSLTSRSTSPPPVGAAPLPPARIVPVAIRRPPLFAPLLQAARLCRELDLLAVDDVEVARELLARLHLAQYRGLALADF